jgi:hypothetical protein
MRLTLVLFAATLLTACTQSEPQGLWLAPDDQGPGVIFNLEATPLPDVPFPIDVATRFDPTSPTRRRVNVSVIGGTTDLENGVRTNLDTMDGFGTYAPIWVHFDSPIDLCQIRARHQANDDFSDDAIYLVNITPGSPAYGRPSLLDLGRGNFPISLANPSNYFQNDPRSLGDSLIFETYDEDVNKDGVYHLELDTDADGVLDHPTNLPVCPDANGNPLPWAYDLPTFYEPESNTLVIRPVLPLDERSTYAVILTRRLTGMNGEPVHSPFKWINHIQQTPDLQPLAEKTFVTNLGLAWDDDNNTSPDIAFAWSFTTESTTSDLVAIRRGMGGAGPLGYLKDRFPPTITVSPLLDRPIQDPATGIIYQVNTLPADWFLNEVGSLLADGLYGGATPGTNAAINSMKANIDYFIAGKIQTPDFLVDPTQGSSSIEDPYHGIFDVDAKSGRATVVQGWADFWCSIPKQQNGHKPPFPVVIYGHGYTSGKLEMLGFAGPMGRLGIAHCGMDAVGHGNVLPQADLPLIQAAISGVPLQASVNMLFPGRAVDLNNDTIPDSGGDFWTANTFHTRDVVRQSIIDHMAFIRLMRQFDGTKKWSDVGVSGLSGIAGDWNGDGVVDLGGPNASYQIWGQSLGGFISSLLGGVEPAIVSAAPVSGGGGLADVGIRSIQGGVVQAVFLPILGPLVIGAPNPKGGVDLQMLALDVNSNTQLTIAQGLPIAQGDIVTFNNLKNGQTRSVVAPAQGAFRLPIAADAVDALEKARMTGLTPNVDSAKWMPVSDPTTLGDGLSISVTDSHGTPKFTVQNFQAGAACQANSDCPVGQVCVDSSVSGDCPTTAGATCACQVAFQGTIYPSGSPLAAVQAGFGLIRQTPSFRRFMTLAQMILEPADPINYAPLFMKNPVDYSDTGDTATPGANLLMVPTVGDMNVPVNTEVSIAKAAGILGVSSPDSRYGKAQVDVLIENYVVEGLYRLNVQHFGVAQQFDIDNLSGGLKTWPADQAPSFPEFLRLNPPMRATVPGIGSGMSGMRIPYVSAKGAHGFGIPDPTAQFDINTYMAYFIAEYFRSNGEHLEDNPCYATASCTFPGW